jgi:hypothetical protein
VTNVSGGVNVDANQVTIHGDVVGRDKIVGYTVEQVSALLTQIGSTFQPKPFDGRCPYLGLDAFTEDEQQLARTIFSGLIEIARGTQDTHRTATFDEWVPANRNAAQIKSVVQKMSYKCQTMQSARG